MEPSLLNPFTLALGQVVQCSFQQVSQGDFYFLFLGLHGRLLRVKL